ncbi:MAG: TRASH domain protein [Thermodesulfobacteriota bacterium]
MSPVKFVILLCLFYLLFRLLTGGKKKVKRTGNSGSASHDVLVEDPICKVCVPMKQAVVLKEEGKTIYFCSLECREKFIAIKGD